MIDDVNVILFQPEQILYEIVTDEIEVVLVSESVVGARNDKDIESFILLNQGVGEPECVCRMDIVVDVSCYEQQFSVQIAGKFDGGGNFTFKLSVSLLVPCLPHSVEGFTPPLGVDVVVVIAGSRDRHFVEIRSGKNCGSCHKSSSGMSVDSHSGDVCKWITVCNLLNHSVVVVKSVVTQIAVAVAVELSSP